MQRQCTYFKYYFEPYNDKGKRILQKKDVIKWKEKYSDDILRPVFEWTGQQVIDYIIKEGQEPNPLYKRGSKDWLFPMCNERT